MERNKQNKKEMFVKVLDAWLVFHKERGYYIQANVPILHLNFNSDFETNFPLHIHSNLI